MKRYTFRVAAALLTFSIGNFSAHRLHTSPVQEGAKATQTTEISSPTPADAPVDSTIYSVRLCDLVGSNRFKGKLVRIQATYDEGSDSATLYDATCGASFILMCFPNETSCEVIWTRLNKAFNSNGHFLLNIDVVGRYFDDTDHPNPVRVPCDDHRLEIIELKGTKPTHRQRR